MSTSLEKINESTSAIDINSEVFILDKDGNVIEESQMSDRGAYVIKSLLTAINDNSYENLNSSFSQGTSSLIPPPIPTNILNLIYQIDETHARCVKTKVIDTVGRPFEILPKLSSLSKYKKTSKTSQIPLRVKRSIETIRSFISTCNNLDKFSGVLDLVAQDFEAIGYGCIEVIRSADFKVRKINHIPAARVLVKSNRQGYVEIVKDNKYVHYQNFGEKVVSKRRKNLLSGLSENYDPALEEELSSKYCQWNLIDKETGKNTSSFVTSANELIFIKNHHNSSIYYGVSDIVPALRYVMLNYLIQNYNLQFFENNAVPHYAVIVEGGKVGAETRESILQYFRSDVKGNAHKTLFIAVPAAGGEVKVRFEKLSAEEKEGSFQAIKKNNQQSIMTAHGVSPAIIGITDSASLGSGKGNAQSENYKDRVIIPRQLRFAEELNNLFAFGLGITDAIIEFDPLNVSDFKQEMEIYVKYLTNGVISINEVREFAKLGDPVLGGDRAFILIGGDIFFVDTMEQAPSTLLEKLDATKKALALKIKEKEGVAQNLEGKKLNRVIDNEPLKEVGLPVGSPKV